MLRDLGWQAIDNLARAQLAMVHALCDEIKLSPDDRRRALNLDDQAWRAWTDFLEDGPLPAQPPLPEMLQRLGETAFNLAVVADQRGSAR